MSGCILLAKFWVFPIPFSIVLGSAIWFVCFLICSVIAVGWKRIRTNRLLREQLGRILSLLSAQSIMILIYPAYNAGFIALTGITQLAFILVLPAIKYFMKWLLNRAGNHTTTTNVLVMTSVDFFEALYLFKCMQSAGSIKSGLALIGVDLIQNFIHLRGLHRKVRLLQATLSDDPRQLDGRDLVRSFIHMSKPRAPLRYQCRPQPNRNVVAPLSSKPSLPSMPVMADHPSDTVPIHKVVGAAIEDFFQECQEVLLVEFIECIVPIFYVLYSTILFHLPNAKYYPEMQHMTLEALDALMGNIAIYAGWEFVSLIYVHWLLKWRFNLSAMHLLAFVLESEQAAFPLIFVDWAVLIMQFTLVHYGELQIVIVGIVFLTHS